MGWFDFTDVETEVSNNSTRTRKSPKTNSDSAKANSDSAKTNSDSAKTEFKKLKVLPVKDSKTPQTVQTYSDLNQKNQTLSEAKRERNLILWKEFDESTRRELSYFAYQVAIPQLPKRPTLPDVWISCYCRELFNQMMCDVEFQKKWEQFSENSLTVKI